MECIVHNQIFILGHDIPLWANINLSATKQGTFKKGFQIEFFSPCVGVCHLDEKEHSLKVTFTA